MKGIAKALCLLLTAVLFSACQPTVETHAVLISNGTIYTMNPDAPTAEAVLTYEGKIAYVGTAQEARAHAEALPQKGLTLEEIDLQGKTMTPGLIESHAHIIGVGTNRMQLDLLGVRSWEEVTRQVAEAAASAEPGEWIVGRGWHQDKWDSLPRMVDGFPTHEALTEAAPDNPVYLKHASGHMAITNEAAMAAAGITREAVSPAGGEIIYDEDGSPTGLFNELAQNLITKVIPEIDTYQALEAAMAECAEYGITSFHDAGSDGEAIATYKQFIEEGKLSTRLYIMLSGRDDDLLNEYYAKGPEIGLGDNRLTIRSIKLYGDGALGSRGAWLHEPYSDDSTTVGMPTTPVERIAEVAREGLQHGFQVCTHAIGDRANTEVLDAYQAAFAEYPDVTDHRFRVEHAQHLTAEDIPRFGEMGVIASMQAIHMSSDRPWAIDRLGEERIVIGAYVWQSLLQSGAIVINGTDAPVEPIDPIASFYASVARKTLSGTPEQGYEIDQRMTRQQALRSYTLDAAYGAFEEDIKGSIEEGKLADFTIYNQDLMTVPENEILNTVIERTIVGGETIYQRGAE